MTTNKPTSKHINLIGKPVVHISWGNGIIEKVSDDNLIIHFKNTDKGERSVKFQLPNAFVKGFLSSTDPQIQNLLSQLIESNKCVICGEIEVKTELINNIRVCQNCKTNRTAKCYLCDKIYDKRLASSLVVNMHYSRHIEKICPECKNTKTFVCQECNRRFHIANQSPYTFDGKVFCNDCFEAFAKVCHFCNNVFLDDEIHTLYDSNDNDIDVCLRCVDTHTFKCDTCGELTLNSLKITSKFIPKNENICYYCVNTCNICSEKIKYTDSYLSFGKHYCNECKASYIKKCSICESIFVSTTSTLCPDCEDAKEYETRIQSLDFQNMPYKELSYYSLDNVDRCELFSELFVNCKENPIHPDRLKCDTPFNFIVLRLWDRKIVITYLDSKIIGNNKHSLNITMTDFRRSKYVDKVYSKISKWLATSNSLVDTSAGSMRILNYPILLRVQTKYDKNYGKEWCGPGDYIETGNNYGDTTDFYIIGVIE